MEEKAKKETEEVLEGQPVKDSPKGKVPDPGTTSDLGLDPKLASALCYIPFIMVGVVVSIVVLLTEKKNNFLRFHAGQALAVFLIQLIVTPIAFIFGVIPCVGALIIFLVVAAFFAFELFLAYKAYQGEYYKIPKIGDFVEKQLKI